MPVIMATRELWREIGDGTPLSDRAQIPAGSTKLDVWSAKCVHLPEGDFCIAVNETTYLTVTFPLTPLPDFLLAFAFALGIQLESLGVPEPEIETETRAFLEGTAFAKNSNRSLLGTLNDLEFHFSVEMEALARSDPDSILSAQQRMNEIPHTKRSIPFPKDATSLLFRKGGSA
jgi:hypothetical protein